MSDVRQAIYRFTPQGHQDVARAIGTVAEAYQRASQQQRIAARKATQAQRESVNEAVRMERERLKSAERTAKEHARSESRAAKEQQRIVARGERDKVALERREQLASRRQSDQAARLKAREADKWNRDRQRLVERSQRDEERAHERAARKQAQIVAQGERQKQREVDKAIRKRERMMESHQDSIHARNASLVGGIGKALGRGAMTAAGLAIGAGGAAIGSSLREQVSLQALARDVSISSRDPGEKGADVAQLQKSWNQTAMRTPGQTAEGVGGAVKAYVSKTGDLDMASKLQDTFAQVASATGADIREIGSAAAELSTKFDIKTVDDMQEAFASMAFQGKKGAFELRDAAGEFARMGSAAQRYGMEKGSRGVKTLGGFAQLAMGATGSASMASTAVDAMLSKLQTQSGVIKTASGGKAKVYEGTGKNKKTRDARDVVAEAVTYIGGNDVEKKNAKLKEIFDTEGLKALSPLVQEFSRALEEGKDPLTAVRAKIEDAAEAGGAYSEVLQDAAARQEDTAAKFEAVWQALGLRVGEKLLPVAEELAEKFLVNDKALDDLVTTAVACGDALSALVDFLKTIPGVKRYFDKPPKTVAEARKDLDLYDQQHGTGAGKSHGMGAMRLAESVAKSDPRRDRLVAAMSEAETFERDIQELKSGKLTGDAAKAKIDSYGDGGMSKTTTSMIGAAASLLLPGGTTGASAIPGSMIGSLFGNGPTRAQEQLMQAAGPAPVQVDAKSAEEALNRAAQNIEKASRMAARGDIFGGIGGKL